MSDKYKFIESYPVDKDGRRKIPVDVFNGEAADKFEDGKGYFLLFGLGDDEVYTEDEFFKERAKVFNKYEERYRSFFEDVHDDCVVTLEHSTLNYLLLRLRETGKKCNISLQHVCGLSGGDYKVLYTIDIDGEYKNEYPNRGKFTIELSDDFFTGFDCIDDI